MSCFIGVRSSIGACHGRPLWPGHSWRPYSRGGYGFFIFDPLKELVVQVRQGTVGQGKTKVVYPFALGNIEAFIMGADLQFGFHRPGMDIVDIFQQRQAIHGDHPFGELIEHRGVRLQVNTAAGDQDLLVDTDELRVSQPTSGPRLSELWVGEGQPDLADLIFDEIGGQLIDMRAEEGGIGDLFFQAFFCADIDTVAFHVYAEKIMLWVHFGEADGVFAFSAGQLQGEGMVVFEKGAPLPCHAFRVLEDVGEGFDGFETDEFFLAHEAKVDKKMQG